LPPVIPESVKTTSASSEPVERKAPASLEDERRKRNETKTYHGVAVASKEMSTGKADLRLSKSAPAAPSEPRQPQKSSIRSAGKIGKDGIYSIQIRAFQDEAKANAFLREVKGDKRSIRIQKAVQEDHKIWYRVLIGRFKNRNEALGYLKKKKIQEAYPGSFIQHAGKTEMKI
jgi:septal ring-binding cell division protein DamX